MWHDQGSVPPFHEFRGNSIQFDNLTNLALENNQHHDLHNTGGGLPLGVSASRVLKFERPLESPNKLDRIGQERGVHGFMPSEHTNMFMTGSVPGFGTMNSFGPGSNNFPMSTSLNHEPRVQFGNGPNPFVRSSSRQANSSGVGSDSENSYASNMPNSNSMSNSREQNSRSAARQASKLNRSAVNNNAMEATTLPPPVSMSVALDMSNGDANMPPSNGKQQGGKGPKNQQVIMIDGPNGPIEGPKSCHCKKSQCLKLYCDCFAAGAWCTNCACVDCYNRHENADRVKEKREAIIQRDPKAFARKIQHDDQSGVRHKKGCNCKKSHCLKKYCECYQGGIKCSEACKCIDCHNYEESPQPAGGRTRARMITNTGNLPLSTRLSAGGYSSGQYDNAQSGPALPGFEDIPPFAPGSLPPMSLPGMPHMNGLPCIDWNGPTSNAPAGGIIPDIQKLFNAAMSANASNVGAGGNMQGGSNGLVDNISDNNVGQNVLPPGPFNMASLTAMCGGRNAVVNPHGLNNHGSLQASRIMGSSGDTNGVHGVPFVKGNNTRQPEQLPAWVEQMSQDFRKSQAVVLNNSAINHVDIHPLQTAVNKGSMSQMNAHDASNASSPVPKTTNSKPAGMADEAPVAVTDLPSMLASAQHPWDAVKEEPLQHAQRDSPVAGVNGVVSTKANHDACLTTPPPAGRTIRTRRMSATESRAQQKQQQALVPTADMSPFSSSLPNKPDNKAALIVNASTHTNTTAETLALANALPIHSTPSNNTVKYGSRLSLDGVLAPGQMPEPAAMTVSSLPMTMSRTQQQGRDAPAQPNSLSFPGPSVNLHDLSRGGSDVEQRTPNLLNASSTQLLLAPSMTDDDVLPGMLGDYNMGDESPAASKTLWSDRMNRYASTPGGIATLLASPCKGGFALGSPPPFSSLDFSRGMATPGSNQTYQVWDAVAASLPAGQFTSPSMEASRVGGNVRSAMTYAAPSNTAGSSHLPTSSSEQDDSQGGRQHEDGAFRLLNMSEQKQSSSDGVVDGVHTFVSPVRTSKRVAGSKRNLGTMQNTVAHHQHAALPTSPPMEKIAMERYRPRRMSEGAGQSMHLRSQHVNHGPSNLGQPGPAQQQQQPIMSPRRYTYTGLPGEIPGQPCVQQHQSGSSQEGSSTQLVMGNNVARNKDAGRRLSHGSHNVNSWLASGDEDAANDVASRFQKTAVLGQQPAGFQGSAGASVCMRKSSPQPHDLEALKNLASDYINSRCGRNNGGGDGGNGAVPTQGPTQQTGTGHNTSNNATTSMPPPSFVPSHQQQHQHASAFGPASQHTGMRSGPPSQDNLVFDFLAPGSARTGSVQLIENLANHNSSLLLCNTPTGDILMESGNLDAMLTSPGGFIGNGGSVWESLLTSPRIATPLNGKSTNTNSMFTLSPQRWWMSGGGGSAGIQQSLLTPTLTPKHLLSQAPAAQPHLLSTSMNVQMVRPLSPALGEQPSHHLKTEEAQFFTLGNAEDKGRPQGGAQISPALYLQNGDTFLQPQQQQALAFASYVQSPQHSHNSQPHSQHQQQFAMFGGVDAVNGGRHGYERCEPSQPTSSNTNSRGSQGSAGGGAMRVLSGTTIVSPGQAPQHMR